MISPIYLCEMIFSSQYMLVWMQFVVLIMALACYHLYMKLVESFKNSLQMSCLTPSMSYSADGVLEDSTMGSLGSS